MKLDLHILILASFDCCTGKINYDLYTRNCKEVAGMHISVPSSNLKKPNIDSLCEAFHGLSIMQPKEFTDDLFKLDSLLKKYIADPKNEKDVEYHRINHKDWTYDYNTITGECKKLEVPVDLI